MGVRGLTSYVNSNSYKFMKNYDLQNTTLIIDGNCVMNKLYFENMCNYCYGGDFAKYAYHVSEFFDELRQCNVTPIIMLDGAAEEKKIKTIIKRSRKRILTAAASTPSDVEVLFPALAKYVFIYLARQRDIRIIQSTYEVDHHVASFARILDCPVLSNDSDFFIYDVKYIPYNKLKSGLQRNSNGFTMRSQVFDRERFFQEFPGTNQRFLLPLAAAILGNDYVSSAVFKNFFVNLKVWRRIKAFIRSKVQLRIVATFNWIQKCSSLDSAVAHIINTIDVNKQKYVTEIIEMIINDYLNPSAEMFTFLDYSQEDIDRLMTKFPRETYKFQSPIESELIQTNDGNETDMSDYNIVDDISAFDNDIVDLENKNVIEQLVPAWFLNRYNKAEFPAYFLDIINRQCIVISEQMEDTSHPPTIVVSLKIINVIFRLLSNGTTNATCLKYITRGTENDVVTYELDSKNYQLTYDIPTLENLITVPALDRKFILLSTLGVSPDLLERFPLKWRLYLAAIKYWMDSADKMFTTNYHLYTLILLIVFHVVQREMESPTKRTSNIASINDVSLDKSLKDALDEIADDCYWADRFFRSKMLINPNQFDITVVYAYSLFQRCLRYSMDLNALLGCPYYRINIADFFSGIISYNLFDDLKDHKKLNRHICQIFEKSPSVLQLFVSMSKEVQDMLKTHY